MIDFVVSMENMNRMCSVFNSVSLKMHYLAQNRTKNDKMEKCIFVRIFKLTFVSFSKL